MNEIDSKTKTLPDKAVATESDDGSLSSLYSQVVKTGYKTLKGAEAYAKRMGFWISEKPKEAKTKRKSSTRKTTKRSCR